MCVCVCVKFISAVWGWVGVFFPVPFYLPTFPSPLRLFPHVEVSPQIQLSVISLNSTLLLEVLFSAVSFMALVWTPTIKQKFVLFYFYFSFIAIVRSAFARCYRP